MILLDSEGIDAVRGEGLDDNQIFTLTVFLASVLRRLDVVFLALGWLF